MIFSNKIIIIIKLNSEVFTSGVCIPDLPILEFKNAIV
jgi:hypothetical protein